MSYNLKIIENTLVDYPRLDKLRDFVNQTKGDIAEVGVYKGGTAFLLASTKVSNRELFLFDTFTGMPESKEIDVHKKGKFNDTSVEYVDDLLYGFPNVKIYKGVFPKQNSEMIQHRVFSLVHLDVDIYDSVKDCLEFFYPRMRFDGIIVLDDYGDIDCPGAKLAADEFAVKYGVTIEPTVQCQAIIRIK